MVANKRMIKEKIIKTNDTLNILIQMLDSIPYIVHVLIQKEMHGRNDFRYLIFYFALLPNLFSPCSFGFHDAYDVMLYLFNWPFTLYWESQANST